MTTAARRAPGIRLDAGWLRLAFLAAGRGGASVLAFLAVLLLARALSPEELGRWSLALALQGHALHLGEFGLRSVVTAEAGRAGAAFPRLLRRYLALRLALSLATLAAVLGATAWLWPDDLLLVALATGSIVATTLQLDWLALVDDRPRLASCLLLVRPAGFLLLVLALADGLTPERTALAFLAAWWLAAILSWPALRRPRAAFPSAMGSPPAVGAMLRRGGALVVVTLTNQAQLSLDLVVAGWVLGTAAAGDYFLAAQIAVAGLLFANAAGQSALARLAPLADDPARFLGTLRHELTRLLWLACVLAAGLGVLGPLLAAALFGPEHGAAAATLPWLVPWFLLQHPTTLLQSALAATGRERRLLLANAVMLAVLAPALALAALHGTLAAFACARLAAEAARLLTLAAGVRIGRPPGR